MTNPLYAPIPAGRQNDSAVKNAVGKLQKDAGQNAAVQASAWCRFNGTPDNPHIDGGLNFRKIEKVSTGRFRLWFEQPMKSTSFAVLVSCGESSPAVAPVMAGCYVHKTDSIEVVTMRVSGAALLDPELVSVVVFGDLLGGTA